MKSSQTEAVLICVIILITANANVNGFISAADTSKEEATAAVQLNFQPNNDEHSLIDAKKTLIWGPGLSPAEIVLPARYFYVHFVNRAGEK